jgi:hypothetical protein
MERESIDVLPPATWRSGIVTGLISAVLAIPTGMYLYTTALIVALFGGASLTPALLASVLLVPGALVFLSAYLRGQSATLTPNYLAGFFGVWIVIGAMLLGFMANQASKREQAAKAWEQARREKEEQHRREFVIQIADPEAIAKLTSSLDDIQIGVLQDRVSKSHDLGPLVLHHVLVTFPQLSCEVASNASASPDDLAKINECSNQLLANPNTPEERRREIYQHSYEPSESNLMIAKYSCDPEMLSYLSRISIRLRVEQEPQSSINRALSHNPCTPDEIFDAVDEQFLIFHGGSGRVERSEYKLARTKASKNPKIRAAQLWEDSTCSAYRFLSGWCEKTPPQLPPRWAARK